jgi:hypothetical protein
MPEPRFPTLPEFWQRLDDRGAEPDLRASLEERTTRERAGTPRLGERLGAVAAAVAGRILPGEVPATALAAFFDESFDRQLGRGDEREGAMATPELLPAGLDALDREATKRHGTGFAELPGAHQDALLDEAERGELPGPDRFDSRQWFVRLREKLLLGYGSDPRGMVEMGFPGPSYETGHVWLGSGEVRARTLRRPGYRIL